MPKSRESGGFSPKHEPSKESPEAEWARWKEVVRDKPQDTAYALRVGKRLGVPESEIEALAQGVLDRFEKEGWQSYGFTYQIMKAGELGTEEERRAMGERAYQQHMQGDNPAGASIIAKELWGENSPQYTSAQEFLRKKEEEFTKEQEKAEPLMRLSIDATFYDFYAVWHDMIAEEGMGIDIEIETDMKNVFGEELTKQVMDFLSGRDNTLERKKVIDFFQKHGFGKEQLGEVLGIDFGKRRTRKKK